MPGREFALTALSKFDRLPIGELVSDTASRAKAKRNRRRPKGNYCTPNFRCISVPRTKPPNTPHPPKQLRCPYCPFGLFC